MNDQRPTELELAAALRAHLPAAARADLREEIHQGTATMRQQRALPSVLGALTDADPIGRQRATLIAAALLAAAAIAGAALVGALNDRERNLLPLGGQGPLTFLRLNDLYLANADGSGAFPVARIDGAELRYPRWSADGRLIAFQTRDGGGYGAVLGVTLSGQSIMIHDVRIGETRWLTPGTFGGWSPDGHSLAYFTTNGDIAIVDAQSGESRVLVARPAGTEGFGDWQPFDPEPLAWSPDGKWIVAKGSSGESLALVRIDAASGATEVLDTTTDFRYAADWSPDSSRVVFAGYNDGLSEALWVTNVDGSDTTEIVEPGTEVQDPHWSPDGAWIAYLASQEDGDGGLMIVRPDGRDARRLADHVGHIEGWSHDGASVAYTTDGEGELHVVTIADGTDRVVSVPEGAAGFAWAKAVRDESGAAVAPSLPAPIASLSPDQPINEPVAGEPVKPDATWGGLALRAPQEQSEFDCRLKVLRFPDQLTILEPGREAAPSQTMSAEPATPAPSAVASDSSAVAGDSCELVFAPDGSAFIRASQREGTIEVVRMDGTPIGEPIRSNGGLPTWSPAGGWIARTNCNEAACSTTIVRPDGSDRRELAAWGVSARPEDGVELPGLPVWSPDDRVLAMPGPDGSLLVGNGDGSELRAIGTFPLPGGWSADGSTFVFVRDGDAWLAEADGSGVRNLTEFPFGGAAYASWSPDGRWITVAQGFTIWAFSPDGSIRQRLGAGMEGVRPVWSPLGTWLALGDNDRVTLFRVDDWHAVRLENAREPAWSRDGRHLAVFADAGVDLMNADGSGRVTVASETGFGHPPLTWLR